MRVEVTRLLKNSPFQPFVIITDSGERILIRHPENVAYDPIAETMNCYAIADGVMHIVPWRKITSVALLDKGEPLPSTKQ